ncbi:thermostable carboxypeptidase 1 [Lachnospiraceae bacterium KM106-2]|nr:thermostable carboxypeptidase 1 [Lachnospiraceae bacterium KM106-2]
MNRTYEKLQEYLDRNQALNTALILLDWDTATLAPKAATEQTARMVGILSEEQFNSIINDEVRELMHQLKEPNEWNQLTDVQKAVIKELEREYEQLEKIPVKEYKAYAELAAKSVTIWEDAKTNNDYKKFVPVLEQIIAYKKKFASYRKKKGQALYDVLLQDYERDFNMEKLDEFFEKIKTELVPFIKEVIHHSKDIDKSYNYLAYDPTKQKEFCEFLAGYIGFDFNKGVIAESAHPFTTNLHNKDVRITNHFYKNNLESAMFSVIHEGGHAIYEMNIGDDITQTLVGGGASMGVHESQSRFYENIVGRNKAFWEPIYAKLQRTYPDQLNDITLDHFMKGINLARLSLIRTEADELTYPLHILVRYEMEKMIFSQEVDVHQLNQIWNQKYKEYLGVTPPTDTAGILQDVHWAMGDFGYFSSYAVGSAIGAQLYEYMKKVMPFEEYLREGKMDQISGFLKAHIHQYGMRKTANELLKDTTGEEFNADYYINYLKEKYTELYLQ